MGTINISRRLILPGLGVIVFLFAYLAQNVWQIFHIDDITRAIRNLDQAGIVTAMSILGFVEATIVLCFYVPGTKVFIVLLLGMQPGWAEAFAAGRGADCRYHGWLRRKSGARPRVAATAAVAGRGGLFPQDPGVDRTLRSARLHPRRVPSQQARGRLRILGYFQAGRVWRYLPSQARHSWSGGASIRSPPT